MRQRFSKKVSCGLKLEAVLLKLEAVLLKLEVVLLKLKAVLLKLEAVLLKLEAVLLKLEVVLLKLETVLLKLEAVLLKYHYVLAVIRIGCFGRRKFNVTLQLSLSLSSLSAEVAGRLADGFEMEATLLYGA
jgi:hypothetical protein